MADDEGPRQVWTWSRVDGSVIQHRVRPNRVLNGCWVEEWGDDFSYGCQQWYEVDLCDTPEEATQQARAHFQKIADGAQAVLSRLDTAP